jgi:hypothetical protein
MNVRVTPLNHPLRENLYTGVAQVQQSPTNIVLLFESGKTETLGGYRKVVTDAEGGGIQGAIGGGE